LTAATIKKPDSHVNLATRVKAEINAPELAAVCHADRRCLAQSPGNGVHPHEGYSNRISVVAGSTLFTAFTAFTAFSVKSYSGSKSAGGNNVLSDTADIYK